jgi:hypothetical protein
MLMSLEIEKKLEKVEKRLNKLEEWKQKTIRDHPLSLKERFAVHDRSMRLIAEFEEMVKGLPDNNVWFAVYSGQVDNVPLKNIVPVELKPADVSALKEIVRNYRKLVDHALGVEYPF